MRKLFLGAVGLVIIGVVGVWLLYDLPRMILQHPHWPISLRILAVYAIAAIPVVLVPAKLRGAMAMLTFPAAGRAVAEVSRFGLMLGTRWLPWLVAGVMLAPWIVLPGRLFWEGWKQWWEQRKRPGAGP